MSNLKFIIFLALLFFTHLLLYQYLSIGEIYPDLFLVMVVFSGLYKGAATGSVAGFLCGLAQDSFSYTFFGLHALVKTIIGFAIGKVRHSFFSNNHLVLGVTIFTTKMAHDAVYYGIYFTQGVGSYWRQILLYSPLAAVYTCLLGLALFCLVNCGIRIESE